MGRPSRQVVDYFSHDCMHTKTLEIVEGQFEHGYKVWFKLLEMLGSTEGHAIDFSDEILFQHFSVVKCRVPVAETTLMMDLFARLEAIDKELWTQDRVVWCQHFVDRLADLYKKRKCSLPGKPSIQRINSVSASDIPGNPSFRSPKSTKESRVKESRVKTTLFVEGENPLRLSRFLFSRILTNNPKAKEPNYQTWAKQVDLTLHTDKRTPEDIQAVIDWCQDDEFWRLNVLSTKKLREKFDQLYLKMTKGGGNGKPPPQPNDWHCTICGKKSSALSKGMCPDCMDSQVAKLGNLVTKGML